MEHERLLEKNHQPTDQEISESISIKSIGELYNPDTQITFNTAYQAHDGRWVYKRVIAQEDLKDVEGLIKTKKKPKKLKN